MQKAYEFDFVYDTQAAFRLLLEALSNPGRIVELGPLTRKLGGAYAMPLTVAAVLWTMRSVLQSAVLLRWQRKLLS